MFKKKGFTLLEMLVVVAIISVIVVLTMPSIDRFFKIRRVHDAALSFASSVERCKAISNKLRKPIVVSRIDDKHFALFYMDQTPVPHQYQPSQASNYVDADIAWPGFFEDRLPNPIGSRLQMSNWVGQFSANEVTAIVVMNDGTLRRFAGAPFATPDLVPLGDIYRAQFTDIDIQARGDQNLKNITSWNVNIEPSGTVSVKRIDDAEDK